MFGSIGLLELVEFVGCLDYTVVWTGSRDSIDPFNLVGSVSWLKLFGPCSVQLVYLSWLRLLVVRIIRLFGLFLAIQSIRLILVGLVSLFKLFGPFGSFSWFVCFA